jgi:hypothetical protein
MEILNTAVERLSIRNLSSSTSGIAKQLPLLYWAAIKIFQVFHSLVLTDRYLRADIELNVKGRAK